MRKPDFNRFFRHHEVGGLLREFEAAFPALARVETIGHSHAGRDIWVLTLGAGAEPLDRPGFYLDAGIHGSEVTGTTAALLLAWTLLSGHGDDDALTALLDRVTVYIVPMVSPDGAEQVLAHGGWVRSTMRSYPFEAERDGLHPQDVDGDGNILSMRIRDDAGDWKCSTRDARLLVPRRFDDTGGEYYRVHAEGIIHNFDGVQVTEAPPRHGVDLNRNFPANWRPESEQKGAGDHPLSEPETRAVARFLHARRNICCVHALHTGMEAILRLPGSHGDVDMARADLQRVLEIGRAGATRTGWELVSFHALGTVAGASHGDFASWAYEQLGLLVFGVELWDLRARSGRRCLDLHRARVEHDLDALEAIELATLAWNDEHLEGAGFVDWYPFEHPQLGPVELGGWRPLLRNNPPAERVEDTASKAVAFALDHARCAPRLVARWHTVETVADRTCRLAVEIVNAGYLPTHVTRRALALRQARPVEVDIELPHGAELLAGSVRTDIGHLAGFGGRRKVEWLVRFAGQPAAQVRAGTPRAGVVRLDLA